MSALARLFFESPLQLAGLGLLLLGLTYIVWLRSESERRPWLWPGVLVLIIVLFAVQSIVTTDREEVREALAALLTAVDRENVPAIAASFATGYDAEGRDHDAIVRFVEDALKDADVFDVRLTQCLIDVNADRATMTLGCMATVRLRGTPYRLPSRWEIVWQRGPMSWQVSSLRPLEVIDRPVSSLSDLPRF